MGKRALAAGEGAERAPRLTPHFRALPMGGARKAFRLEEIYWEALEAIARRNHRTLTEEVAATLARAGEGGNDAAALRASITSDLFDLWQIAAARHVRFDWARVIEEMPAQAFVVTASQALVAANPRLLRALHPFGVGRNKEALKVSIDPTVIAQVERRGGFVDCQVCFFEGGARAIRRARLGPASDSAAAHNILLGYLEG